MHEASVPRSVLVDAPELFGESVDQVCDGLAAEGALFVVLRQPCSISSPLDLRERLRLHERVSFQVDSHATITRRTSCEPRLRFDGLPSASSSPLPPASRARSAASASSSFESESSSSSSSGGSNYAKKSESAFL